MTFLRGETEERWRQLCEQAVIEQDPERFVSLIQELLQELENEDQERRRNSAELGLPPTESRRLTCPAGLKELRRSNCFLSPRLAGLVRSAVKVRFGRLSIPNG